MMVLRIFILIILVFGAYQVGFYRGENTFKISKPPYEICDRLVTSRGVGTILGTIKASGLDDYMVTYDDNVICNPEVTTKRLIEIPGRSKRTFEFETIYSVEKLEID